MMNTTTRRLWLATTAMTLASGLAAHAQSAPPHPPATPESDSAPTVSEVVVTGARAAQRKAILDKLAGAGVQDSVRQDDIGRLPDTTIAEAARRIPGVSVDLLTDPARGRTEVQRAAIRGFDAKYNLVTVDGSQVASIDTGALANGQTTRAFNLNLLPASLVSELVVRKTLIADDDPQALGGQVDLVTRSAFDSRNATYADFTAFGGLDTTSGDSITGQRPSARASAIVSHRIDLDGSKLGVVLSAEYQRTRSASNGETIGVQGATNPNNAYWTYYGAKGRSVAGPDQSATPAVPTRFQAYSFDDDFQHYSVSGKVEYATDTGLKTSLFGGYYVEISNEDRDEALLTRTASAIAGTGAPGTGAPANLTPTSGFFSSNDGELGLTHAPLRQNTSFLNWKTSYRLTPDIDLHLDAAYSQAGGHLYRDQLKYVAAATVAASGSVSAANSPALGFTYDTNGAVPSVTLSNPAALGSPGAFVGDYWRSIHFDETNRVFEVHPSLSWNAGPEATGFGLRAGAQFTHTTIAYTPNFVEYDPKVPSQFAMANVLLPNSLTIPGFGGIPFGVIDRAKADAVLAANLSQFTSINELSTNLGNAFDVTEQTTAGYVTGVYTRAKLKVQAGLRYDSTTDDLGSYQQVSNNVYQPQTSHSGYNKLLPSGVASYSFTDNLIGHVAYSQSLGRPDFSAYAPLAKVGQPSAGNISIALGNPAIRPRENNNYDASLDFYFDHHRSLASIQYFHKDLTNELYNLLFSQPYAYNGVTYTGNFTQPRNGATATVDGVELNLQKDRLEFIPRTLGDVGFAVNYTYIATDFTIIDANNTPRVLHNLTNQPRDILNATLFYTYSKLDASLTFNRQGTTLYQTGAAYWQDAYILPRNQLDVSARYRLTPRLTLIAEAANLTGEPFQSALGPQKNLVADQYKIGTTVWVGANLKY